MQIRVFVAASSPIIRCGIKTQLANYDDISVIYESENLSGFISQRSDLNADILIMTIPWYSTIEIDSARQVKEANKAIKIIYFLTAIEAFYSTDILSSCDGIIRINSSPKELVRCIKEITPCKESYRNTYDKKIIKTRRNNRDQTESGNQKLTSREIEIFKLFGEGYYADQIVDKLCITRSTFEFHKKNILEKLGIDHTYKLISIAAKQACLKEFCKT